MISDSHLLREEPVPRERLRPDFALFVFFEVSSACKAASGACQDETNVGATREGLLITRHVRYRAASKLSELGHEMTHLNAFLLGPVFHKIVSIADSWGTMLKKQSHQPRGAGILRCAGHQQAFRLPAWFMVEKGKSSEN
jgi:hypothetical protein